jgi:hypothetical protein
MIIIISLKVGPEIVVVIKRHIYTKFVSFE